MKATKQRSFVNCWHTLWNITSASYTRWIAYSICIHWIPTLSWHTSVDYEYGALSTELRRLCNVWWTCSG